MFTGIVTAIGEVETAVRHPHALVLTLRAPYPDLALGESIAVDGACLTVTAIGAGTFSVDVVPTTLERTLFGEYHPGRPVNLERALQLGDRLGGHLVQGHVDGIAEVIAVRQTEEVRLVHLRVPTAVGRVSIPLGSITVAGVSVTINELPGPCIVQVSLIPFTCEHTTLGGLAVGRRVHVEGDTVGKYVDALLAAREEDHRS